LNLISYRGELQGVSSASRGLFGKDPGGLNALESLVLASLIPSPNASTKAVTQRACLLGASLKARPDSKEIASFVGRRLSVPYSVKPRIALAPHAAARLLKDGKNRAISTIDKRLQCFVIDTLRSHLTGLRERHVLDGAALVAENETGQILAYVGNMGEDASARHVDGIRARRQAGSTLKPFLYALAF
ncbi:MAG: penicillin-binding protein 1C, partial [Deltaproteobacteria bacterium]|nr:penicillin-binding protein 1C [Deltaproteobacteria bacterium]